MLRFEDRRDAGRRLGQEVIHHAATGAIVLGLPRGGVVVADEVARTLDCPLDVWVVRKLGVPFQPELGMGAIAEGPSLVLDRTLIAELGITPEQIIEVVRAETEELRRRVKRFRGDRGMPELAGRTVVMVDDGIATGGTVRAAARGLRKRGAGHLVLATPLAAPEALAALQSEVDEIVCLHSPHHLMAIGLHYDDFRQVSDDEVVRILEQRRASATTTAPEARP